MRPRLGLAARRLLAREEPGVAERDGGVIGQPHEDRLVAVGERARRPVVDVDEALDPLAHPDGRHQHGDAALGADHVGVVGMQPGVVEHAARARGPAGRQHLAGEALAPAQKHMVVVCDTRAHRVAEHHPLTAGVPQRDAGEVGAAQVLGGGGHATQHRVEVERGIDGPGQLGEQLGLAPAPLGLRVEPRVVQGDRRVVGQRLGQPHLVRREDSPEPVAGREGADDPPLDPQRHRQHRPIRRLLDPLARARRRVDLGIVQHVGAGDGPAALDRAAHDASAPRHDPARTKWPHVAADRQAHEVARGGIDAIDGRGRGAQQATHQLGDALRDRIEIEPLGEKAAELGDGLRLAAAHLLERQQPGPFVLGLLAVGDVVHDSDEATRPAPVDVGDVDHLQAPHTALDRPRELERGPPAGQGVGQMPLDAGVSLGTDHLGHVTADDVRGRQAVALRIGPVDEAIAPAGVDVVDELGRGVRHQPQELLARRQPPQHAPTAGHDPRRAYADGAEDHEPHRLARARQPVVRRRQEVIVEGSTADGRREQRRAEAAEPGHDEHGRDERRARHVVHQWLQQQREPERGAGGDQGQQPPRGDDQSRGHRHARSLLTVGGRAAPGRG